MIQDKIKENKSYLVATNYWTPLNDDDEEEPNEATDEINAVSSVTVITKQKGNKWTRRVA